MSATTLVTPVLFGRRVIYTGVEEITRENIVDVLSAAMAVHVKNRAEIQYLWEYYKGKQPILYRVKNIRPEINTCAVINRANEIVEFKTGYLLGEPVAYVSRNNSEQVAESLNKLNEYVIAEEKASKDKELSDWMHICGTSYRIVLPDADKTDESPFEMYTLDPRNTFVVYSKALGNEPVLGVRYVLDDDGNTHFSCYTKDRYYEVIGATGLDAVTFSGVADEKPHILGDIPIVEYPLNMARLGAFEVVITLLDAINQTESDRVNGVEGFVQALMRFHNVDISSEDFDALREKGAIKYKDIDQNFKANVDYITNELKQGETQTLIDDMYETVLTICGMPNRNTGNGDNGIAVVYRDGWSAAETRAKDAELMFKKSERRMLKILINICKAYENMTLAVKDIEIRFTRRNYENILQKAQVLDLMLKNEKVAPILGFQHCGMFADPDLAYSISEEYAKNEVTTDADSPDIGQDERDNRAIIEERQQS